MSETTPPRLHVKPGRQFPFLARHPWVHAHALADDGAEMRCGDVVDLMDAEDRFLGRGLVNPASKLRIRLYSFQQDVEIDADFFCDRIDSAIARRRIGEIPTDLPQRAERLIFSESDLLSGLIVDRYADCLGVQFTAGALLRYREPILEHLRTAVDARQIVIRIDAKTAKHEGVDEEASTLIPTDSLSPIEYRQNGLGLRVDLLAGQKTGGYLDQRCNHAAAAVYCTGKRVLDVCCYTGGFGLVAAKNGAASITSIDSSATALDGARASAERNGLAERMTFLQEDCFDGLNRLREAGEKYDVVVLDPPRFAGSRHQIDQAIRAYRRLNSLAVDLLPPGGVLVTCSCSGRVSRSDFLNMLVDVGRRCGRDLVVLESRGPAPDHPMAVSCPESDYLKCVIAQIS